MKQKNWFSGKTKLKGHKEILKTRTECYEKRSIRKQEASEMKNKTAEKNLNKKAGRYSWENPPKSKVKRERERQLEKEREIKRGGRKGEEEREIDEKDDGQYKRNRWPICEVYHPMKRCLSTEKNGRGDIIKEIIEDNFPDLKRCLYLPIKKVLRYWQDRRTKAPHQTHSCKISNDQKINGIFLKAFRKEKPKSFTK